MGSNNKKYQPGNLMGRSHQAGGQNARYAQGGQIQKQYTCPVCQSEFSPNRDDLKRQIFCHECHDIIKGLVDMKKNAKLVE